MQDKANQCCRNSFDEEPQRRTSCSPRTEQLYELCTLKCLSGSDEHARALPVEGWDLGRGVGLGEDGSLREWC